MRARKGPRLAKAKSRERRVSLELFPQRKADKGAEADTQAADQLLLPAPTFTCIHLGRPHTKSNVLLL